MYNNEAKVHQNLCLTCLGETQPKPEIKTEKAKLEPNKHGWIPFQID